MHILSKALQGRNTLTYFKHRLIQQQKSQRIVPIEPVFHIS